MVDILSLALTHGLLAFAAWRLLWRDDLDSEPAQARDGQADKPWLRHGGRPETDGPGDA